MIEVEISTYNLHAFGHDTIIGAALMTALREAAVPVTGSAFVITGVKYGRLEYHTEQGIDGETQHFTWRANEDDRKVGQPSVIKLKSGGIVRKWGQHAEDDEL